VFPPRVRPVAWSGGTAPVAVVSLGPQAELGLPPEQPIDGSTRPPAKRRKIWELAETLHCSIVGTCLSTADLRHVLVRLGVPGAAAADEHELHVLGVTLASRREAGAKMLQKALDRRHELAIKQYARPKTDETLRQLWEESVRQGDIPGAYWAILSHPLSGPAIIKKAFQDVHMLSHLVGAANRADIRRLRQLEQEHRALTETLHRQQQLLRDGFTSRDQTIRRLNESLARRLRHPTEESPANSESVEEAETFTEVIAALSKKLEQETSRRQRLEQRMQTMSAELLHARADIRAAQRERDALQRELELIEGRVVDLLQPVTSDCSTRIDLAGSTLLYVGGRANQVPALKALVERTGARFLHHDGGIEHNSTLLPGLISRADRVLFPTDCVSHDAMAIIKRICGQLKKQYEPLRTASLSNLLVALSELGRGLDAQMPVD